MARRFVRVCDDTCPTASPVMMASAFRSAGQRCSALRLLVLQEDVAQRTLEMLTGAMDTLVVGEGPHHRQDRLGQGLDEGEDERDVGFDGRADVQHDRI
mgnify:CR=1 FL=1